MRRQLRNLRKHHLRRTLKAIINITEERISHGQA